MTGQKSRLFRISAIVISVAVIGVFVAGYFLGWFKTTVPAEFGHEQSEIGGMEFSTVEGNNVSLTSAVIPTAQYADYGISAAAEAAQTVTASVKSNGVEIELDVDWAAAWKNPSSSWATGKTVTSYVKVTPLATSGENGRKANVECLQAFGEEVTITCSVRGDAEKKATVSVHYVQKVENTTIKFGDIACDFSSGMTQIPFSAKNPQVLAQTGKSSLKYSMTCSTPYTKPLTITCVADGDNCETFQHDSTLENPSDNGTIYAVYGKTTTAGPTMNFTPYDFSQMDPIANGIDCTFYGLYMGLCRYKSARSGKSYTQYTYSTLLSDYNTYGTDISKRKLYNLTFTFSCPEAQMQPVTKKTTICIKEITDIQADSVSVDKAVLYY